MGWWRCAGTPEPKCRTPALTAPSIMVTGSTKGIHEVQHVTMNAETEWMLTWMMLESPACLKPLLCVVCERKLMMTPGWTETDGWTQTKFYQTRNEASERWGDRKVYVRPTTSRIV